VTGITVGNIVLQLDRAVATEPSFDILVTVTILRNGDDWANGSDGDAAGVEDLEEAVAALGAALGRSVALEALEQEKTGQRRLGG
jgi:hypothetical protein